jgi:hypothetical protein
MNVSPNISALLNLIVALVAMVTGASAEWTTLFGAGTAANILADAGIVGTVIAGINAFLHAQTPAGKAGVMARRP